jgi:hypothetical protein
MLTQKEEAILRLMINELVARKKLDVVRASEDKAVRDSINPIIASIKNTYTSERAQLEAVLLDAENALKAVQEVTK